MRQRRRCGSKQAQAVSAACAYASFMGAENLEKSQVDGYDGLVDQDDRQKPVK
jgi:hypothetical protein